MGRREAGPEEVLGAVLFLLPDKVLILPPWLPRARLLGLPASLWLQMAGNRTPAGLFVQEEGV